VDNYQPLARAKYFSYTVVANSKIDRFRVGVDETNRVFRPRCSGAAACRARGWSAIQPTCSAHAGEPSGGANHSGI